MRSEQTGDDRSYRRSLSGSLASSCAAYFTNALLHQLQNRLPIRSEQFDPGPFVHLRNVDTAEEQAHDKVHDARIDTTPRKQIDHLFISLRAIRGPPGSIEFILRFRNRHLQWRMRHPVKIK